MKNIDSFEDVQFILAIIGFILAVCVVVGGIIYRIHQDNITCFDVFVENSNNEDLYYHCTHYYEHKDSFELIMHDNSKIYLLKSNIKNIYFTEIKDNEN